MFIKKAGIKPETGYYYVYLNLDHKTRFFYK